MRILALKCSSPGSPGPPRVQKRPQMLACWPGPSSIPPLGHGNPMFWWPNTRKCPLVHGERHFSWTTGDLPRLFPGKSLSLLAVFIHVIGRLEWCGTVLPKYIFATFCALGVQPCCRRGHFGRFLYSGARGGTAGLGWICRRERGKPINPLEIRAKMLIFTC